MGHDMSGDGLLRIDGTRYGYAIVKLCKGVDQGRDFYAYVAVEPQDLQYFYEHYTPGEHTHFEPFGEELLRGWGDAPPKGIVEHFQQKHKVYFCRDERSILALTEKVREDLSRSGAHIASNDQKRPRAPEDQFIEFCKRSLENPVRRSGH